jgi:hypothetical protein
MCGALKERSSKGLKRRKGGVVYKVWGLGVEE